jgi:putative transcriptional regulator
MYTAKETAMNNIAQQRKKIGVSQAVLATAIGWGQSRIANYELNIRTPGLNDCRVIVEALKKLGCKCSLDEVFPPSDSKAA